MEEQEELSLKHFGKSIQGKTNERENEKKLKAELEEKTKLAEERLNQLKYLQADFDNYRKKFEKEKEDIIKLANENIIKEFLVVVDELELFFKKENFGKENEKMKEGLLLLQRNFLKILEKHGLKKIDALGKKFDPNFHEVLLKEPGDKEGIVLEELQNGYTLKSKVIRPSLVKVSEELSWKESSQRNDEKHFLGKDSGKNEKEKFEKENEKCDEKTLNNNKGEKNG